MSTRPRPCRAFRLSAAIMVALGLPLGSCQERTQEAPSETEANQPAQPGSQDAPAQPPWAQNESPPDAEEMLEKLGVEQLTLEQRDERARAAARRAGKELVIEDLVEGEGEPAQAGDTITMHFVARLADGEIYDSTERRQRSWTISLDDPGLILGLRDGVPGMRVGGKRKITIPWQMAYGEQGRPPIPPETDIIYEIELLEIE